MDPLELKNEPEVIITDVAEMTETNLDTDVISVNPKISEASENISENVSSDKIISEESLAEETTETLTENTTASNLVNTLTKAEMVEQLKKLLEQEVEVVKNEVEELRQQFYKKVKEIGRAHV